MPVGTEEYSSLNTILLCAILEEVSGMPAERFIKENILLPLKMTNTYLLEEPGTDWFNKIPRTYGVHDGEPEIYWIPGQHPSMYPFFRGATGAATTVKDYARFLQMWLNKGKLNGKRVLEESTVEEALSNNGKSIGLHWFVPESPDVGDVFGHAGWYGTCGAAYQKDNAIVLYFTQTYNNPKISEFYELLSYSGILEHKGPYDIQKELPNLPEQPNSEFLKAFEGTYRAVTGDGLEWTANIVMTKGHLEANIRSEVDSWTDKLVFVKPDTFAPGFIKGSTALAVAPKVFYQFNGVGRFDITVLGHPEFSFKTIKSLPEAHSED